MTKRKNKPLYHRPSNFHQWGENDWDEAGLHRAISFITRVLRTIGRIGVHSKEKYGTARISVYFFHGTLFCLLYPGYVWYGFLPRPLRGPLCQWKAPEAVTRIIQRYQALVYRATYKVAFARWPHLWLELGANAEHGLLNLDARSFGWYSPGQEEKE